MFGYVKPVRCKLDDKSWEQYRAAYCGLCHTLAARFGFFARFIVNYDFTFLTVLLYSLDTQETGLNTTRKTCVASPFCKKCVCVQTRAFELAADASMVLFWWKLKDAVWDKSFFMGLPFRFLCLFFRRAYQKAYHNLPQFSDLVRGCIFELQTLEKERVASLDRPADTFARILAALSKLCPSQSQIQAEEMLYHLGRFIYLIDAWDDLAVDFSHRRYNPIVERFSLSSKELPSDMKTELEQTLCHSIHAAEIAFEQLDCTALRSLLKNVINPGLFAVMREVSAGKSAKKEKE